MNEWKIKEAEERRAKENKESDWERKLRELQEKRKREWDEKKKVEAAKPKPKPVKLTQERKPLSFNKA